MASSTTLLGGRGSSMAGAGVGVSVAVSALLLLSHKVSVGTTPQAPVPETDTLLVVRVSVGIPHIGVVSLLLLRVSETVVSGVSTPSVSEGVGTPPASVTLPHVLETIVVFVSVGGTHGSVSVLLSESDTDELCVVVVRVVVPSGSVELPDSEVNDSVPAEVDSVSVVRVLVFPTVLVAVLSNALSLLVVVPIGTLSVLSGGSEVTKPELSPCGCVEGNAIPVGSEVEVAVAVVVFVVSVVAALVLVLVSIGTIPSPPASVIVGVSLVVELVSVEVTTDSVPVVESSVVLELLLLLTSAGASPIVRCTEEGGGW